MIDRRSRVVRGIMITFCSLAPRRLGCTDILAEENQVCIRVGCSSLTSCGWPRVQAEHCLQEEPNYRVKLADQGSFYSEGARMILDESQCNRLQETRKGRIRVENSN